MAVGTTSPMHRDAAQNSYHVSLSHPHPPCHFITAEVSVPSAYLSPQLRHFSTPRLPPPPARRTHRTQRAAVAHILSALQIAIKGLANCWHICARQLPLQEDRGPAERTGGLQAHRTCSGVLERQSSTQWKEHQAFAPSLANSLYKPKEEERSARTSYPTTASSIFRLATCCAKSRTDPAASSAR
jgi:hypothetical protein